MADTVTPPFVLSAPRPLRDAPSPAVERAKVQELAQEFEAMLMLQMVRQMRQSLLNEAEEPEGFGGSTMRDTFDTEFSRYLAQAGGIGLGGFMTSALDARASQSVPPGDGTGSGVSGLAPRALAPAAMTGVEVAAVASPAFAIGRSTDNTDAPASLGLPLAGGVSSSFGWRADPFTGESRFHRGLDLRAAYGTEVPAAADGTVVFAGERGTYGTLVVLRHDSGVETRYAHLSAAAVREGDRVEAGTPIGRVGSSGRSAAPHLHFEVLVNGERVDPAEWAGRVGRGPLKSDDGAVD
jgi:murein DD-endopeptidase MepM/ murein hydrolase activator NlpD